MQELNELSRSLLKVHKSLLRFQKEIQEAKIGKLLSPHEVLSLALGSPDFEWLRQISSLLVRIDEGIDDKESDKVDLYAMAKIEIRNVLKLFHDAITQALAKDPALWAEMNDLKKRIAEAE